MTIIQPVLTIEHIDEIKEYINQYRLKNQAAPLEWDNTIYIFAQKWSSYMTKNNVFKHSGSYLYGENIAYFRGYGTDIMVLIKLAIDNWYNEISLYNFNKPGFSEATGHFTCLVWQASKTFGMGITMNDSTNEAYISFNSSPPGNIIGQFQQNVLPLSYLPTPTPVPTPVPRPTPTPTNNKQLIIFHLQKVINEININYKKLYIIRDINNIINEIQMSSPF